MHHACKVTSLLHVRSGYIILEVARHYSLQMNQNVRNMQSMCSSLSPQELAQHPAIGAIMDYKWKSYARWFYM